MGIPRSELVVLAGLSDLGKSSLAFDTIYTEGQRRYMESLSSCVKQFLEQMRESDVESIEGPSPAISIDQKPTNRDSRSTVGTVTEIYDYIRPLYARIGIPHCSKCDKEIRKQAIDQTAGQIISMFKQTEIQLLAPVVRGCKNGHVEVLDQIGKSGYMRVHIDSSLYEFLEEIRSGKNVKHNIEIVMDYLIAKEGIEKRFMDSTKTVMVLNGGLVMMDASGGEPVNFGRSFSYPDYMVSIDEVEPRNFSLDNPLGACPECSGLGYRMESDKDLMISDKSLFVGQGVIVVMGWQSRADRSSSTGAILEALPKAYDFRLDTPSQDYPREIHDVLLYGTGGWGVKVRYKSQRGGGVYDVASEGLIEDVNRRYKETFSGTSRAGYKTCIRVTPCLVHKGQRLKKEFLTATMGGMNIYETADMSIVRFKEFMDGLRLIPMQETISTSILGETRARICFLIDVGLDYLSLPRATSTLSSGEAQRIRLATQIGSDLVGVAYILDKPSIGLHQRGNDRLLKTLTHLRDLDNSVSVVEYDENTMWTADCTVDIGPGAGGYDEKVIAMGTAEEIMENPDSTTGAYLSGRLKIPMLAERRKPIGWITVRGAAKNNLRNINVNIPPGVMVCVTGVPGSGKSSLVNRIAYRSLARKLNRARTIPDRYKCTEGVGQLDKTIDIDQSPTGRTPRSDPATYTGVFDLIRDLFAPTLDVKAKGYNKGRFNFNAKGERYEACGGDGTIKIEMHFLPDTYVLCEVCDGRRYNRGTLDVKYKGKNIYDILNITVEEALKFFENVPSVIRKTQALYDARLGYIRLEQPFTELSGDEAQRIKLATELSKRDTGRTIHTLDEPITGLRFADVHKLIDILYRLSEGDNTVVVIKHNLDAIKIAGYIIDVGPEGGGKGGAVIARGTPGEVARYPVFYTRMYVKKYLN